MLVVARVSPFLQAKVQALADEKVDRLQENTNLMDQLRVYSLECRQQEKDLNIRAKTVVTVVCFIIVQVECDSQSTMLLELKLQLVLEAATHPNSQLDLLHATQ
jgi:hypothetical protein